MRRKNRSGRWTVPPTGHKKGADVQGIRTASAAGAETLSDALGTRLICAVLACQVIEQNGCSSELEKEVEI